jgi:biopolymer transport protein ExbD/biopolymer transport protein TolR
MSEINITPLLDLAFVLLIIFVITRPMLEGRVKITLPEGTAGNTNPINRQDVRVVEIRADGSYWLEGRSLRLNQVEADLVRAFRDNPKLTVDIRADKSAKWDSVYGLVDVCMRNHITRISPRTVAAGNR